MRPEEETSRKEEQLEESGYMVMQKEDQAETEIQQSFAESLPCLYWEFFYLDVLTVHACIPFALFINFSYVIFKGHFVIFIFQLLSF